MNRLLLTLVLGFTGTVASFLAGVHLGGISMQKEITRLDEGYAMMLMIDGKHHLEEGNVDWAIGRYHAASGVLSEWYFPYVELARISESQGRFALASEYVSLAISCYETGYEPLVVSPEGHHAIEMEKLQKWEAELRDRIKSGDIPK